MTLRQRVEGAVEQYIGGDEAALEALVAETSGAVRFLLGMTYRQDPTRRRAGARGLALAARHRPKLIGEVIRRLVWAMNDESGTNGLTAPDVLLAIAEEKPELLLPVVPDLTRLSADAGLQGRLRQTLECLSTACPGQVGERIARSLTVPGEKEKRWKCDR
jgi:hypothetical protein